MIALFLLCCLADPKIHLASSNKVTLNAEFWRAPAEICLDGQGGFFTLDIDEVKLQRFDDKGAVLYSLSMNGQGPGEFIRPYGMMLLNNGKEIALMELNADWQTFDVQTGKFQEVLHPFFPSMDILPVGDTGHAIAALAHYPGKPGLFYRIDDLGQVVNHWGERGVTGRHYEEKGSKVLRSYVMTATWDGGVLLTEALYLEALRFREGDSEAEVMPLLPPKHYREPKRMPFNRLRSLPKDDFYAWLESFTPIYDLLMLDREHFLVNFKIAEPYLYGADIYHLDSGQRVVAGIQLPGRPFAMKNNRLYCYAFIEEPDDGSLGRVDIHTLTWSPPR